MEAKRPTIKDRVDGVLSDVEENVRAEFFGAGVSRTVSMSGPFVPYESGGGPPDYFLEAKEQARLRVRQMGEKDIFASGRD